jgi:hypothetical protein
MNEDLRYASEEDIAFFNKCITGLPEDPGYSCGPHSVRCLRQIVEIVNPLNILEIGFNVGRSSSLWLELSSASICSVDVSNSKETMDAVMHLMLKYNDRFDFICTNSKDLHYKNLAIGKWDIIFIDGDHSYEMVKNDIELAIDLNIPWIALDDWMPEYGPGVQPAAKSMHLDVVRIMGNIALAKNPHYDGYTVPDILSRLKN